MNDPIVQKINSNLPYKNGSFVLGTTGRGDYQTLNTYVQNPTSASGTISWPMRFNDPGEFVKTLP